jgi:mRNA-decapping enzyme subunit 2
MLSEWSPYHHSAAFSEFLAYKTRVPVRGAILLNDTMDQVVLVKGWKKGANWSFPRGKINKDEKDLDCAVREVFEETGFDIKAARLVGEEKDANFIEVTMREQHMRLYVFRGVPMDTPFEPRTRKEISKIEWYKLSELPTLKKQKHHDGNGQDLATNAHKFYMVAPFLVPLKKWIAQQKKRDMLRGEYEAQLAPTAILEEPITEDEQVDTQPPVTGNTFTAHTPSDLPEVSISRSGETQQDATLHLKRVLNIDSSTLPSQNLGHLAEMDSSKSSSLLALLRGESKATEDQRPDLPVTTLEQVAPPKMPQTLHHQHPHPPQFSQMPPPPAYPFPPGPTAPPSQQYPANAQSYPWSAQPGYRTQHMQDLSQRSSLFQFPAHVPSVPQSFPRDNRSLPPHQASFDNQAPESGEVISAQSRGPAPYQRTGDPQFAAMPQFPNLHIPSIPPASRLPPTKLTHQSMALLNAFKANGHTNTNPYLSIPQHDSSGNQLRAPTVARSQPSNPPAIKIGIPGPRSHAIDPSHVSQINSSVGAIDEMERPFAHRMSVDSSNKPDPHSEVPGSSEETPTQGHAKKSRPRSQHQENLLSLFRKPSLSAGGVSSPGTTRDAAPVELSANPSPLPARDANVARTAKRASPKLAKINTQTPNRSKERLTSATVSGPLNQPQFDIMTRSTNRRPSAASNIIDRAQKPKSPPISTRPRSRDAGNFATKTLNQPQPTQAQFQPQILRRSAQATDPVQQEPILKPSSVPHQPNFDRRDSQPEPQKQNLLALFGKSMVSGRSPVSATNSPPVAPSPASMISPLADMRIGASPLTRSRIGSLSSMVGAVSQTTTSTTSAADKKFLLDYLEGFARGAK